MDEWNASFRHTQIYQARRVWVGKRIMSMGQVAICGKAEALAALSLGKGAV